MMPQTLEPVMGGREGPEVAGFLERNLRGRVKRESDWEGGSKCKMFDQNFKCKIFCINFLRLIWLIENILPLTKYFTAKQTS